MADLTSLLNHAPTSLKAAWMLWLVWSVAQIGWYRRLGIAVPAPLPELGRPLERRLREPKARLPEDVTAASEPQPLPAEPARHFGGTFISLGLDERRSASVDQPVG